VVDVRVRQHDGVEARRVDRELSVALERLVTPALEEAAVEEHGGARRSEQVLGPGDGLGRADEGQLDHADRTCKVLAEAARLARVVKGEGA
jgi:hypothetical protein